MGHKYEASGKETIGNLLRPSESVPMSLAERKDD